MIESGIDMSYDGVSNGDPTSRKASPRPPGGGGVGATMVRSRQGQLRANTKMLLMKQQIEQEKARTRGSGCGGQSMHSGVAAVVGSLPVSSSMPDIDLSTRSQLVFQAFLKDSGQSHAVECKQPSRPVGLGQTAPVRYIVVSTDTRAQLGGPCSAPTDVVGGGPRYNVTSPLSAAGDIGSNATSISDADDFLNDDSLSLEAIDPLNDKDLDVLSALLPEDILTAESYADPRFTTDIKLSLKPSASCPAMSVRPPPTSGGYRGGRQKEPPPPVMTEAERLQWEKDRLKKDNHNIIEKRRRYKINDCITELARLLPQSYDLDLQNKKGVILQASVDYIKRLQQDQEEMSEIVTRHEELEKANRQLMLDIQKLQMTLKSQQLCTAAPAPEPMDQPTSAVDHQPLLMQDIILEQNMHPADCQGQLLQGDDHLGNILFDYDGQPDILGSVMPLATGLLSTGPTDMDLGDFNFTDLADANDDSILNGPTATLFSTLSNDMHHL
jgi:hypothetical protein